MRCRVLTPGRLGSRRHINLPGVDVNLPSLTEKDERDFGRRRGGVRLRRAVVRPPGRRRAGAARAAGQLGSKARIVAKIEDQGGLRNLDEIVKVADAVMVARGRPGDRDRLPRAAAGAAADRRPVPGRGQAGHHRHASAGIDDLRADAHAGGDLRRLHAVASAPTPSCSPARRRPGCIRWSASR